MAFPKVHYCLVCEHVREEVRGLLSVLGFYGVLPAARIDVLDFNQPVGPMMLVFGADAGDEARNYSVVLTLDRGGDPKPVFQSPPGIKAPIAKDTGNIFGIQISGTTFPAPGVYRVRLSADGATAYETSLTLRRAPA